MNDVVAFCNCGGGACTHHKRGEPCLNQAVPAIYVVHDPITRQPAANSPTGLCVACSEHREENFDWEGEQ
jgi:hypothetical protein